MFKEAHSLSALLFVGTKSLQCRNTPYTSIVAHMCYFVNTFYGFYGILQGFITFLGDFYEDLAVLAAFATNLALFGTPFSDSAMIAGEEDFWDGHTPKISRFGVLRIFKIVSIRETLDRSGSFPAKNAWQKARNTIDKN